MPKPRRYTVEQVCVALKETHGLRALAAVALGCHVNTIDNYIAKYPKVAATVKHEKEALLDMAEAQLYRALKDREAWAICFFLKTQGKGRKYSERMEVTGADGEKIGGVQVTVVSPEAKAATDKVISGERTTPPLTVSKN